MIANILAYTLVGLFALLGVIAIIGFLFIDKVRNTNVMTGGIFFLAIALLFAWMWGI